MYTKNIKVLVCIFNQWKFQTHNYIKISQLLDFRYGMRRFTRKDRNRKTIKKKKKKERGIITEKKNTTKTIKSPYQYHVLFVTYLQKVAKSPYRESGLLDEPIQTGPYKSPR